MQAQEFIKVLTRGNPGIIYAVVDNQAHRPEEKKEEKPAITKEMLKVISSEDFLKLKNDDLNKFLDDNNFPHEYSASKIKTMVNTIPLLQKENWESRLCALTGSHQFVYPLIIWISFMLVLINYTAHSTREKHMKLFQAI